MHSDFFLQLFQCLHTIAANIFVLVSRHTFGITTEHTGGSILFQHDRIPIHIDFKCILFRDVQSPPQFDRQNNSAQLIYFSYDPCLFQ